MFEQNYYLIACPNYLNYQYYWLLYQLVQLVMLKLVHTSLNFFKPIISIICYYTIININPGKSIPIKVIDNHFPTFVNKLSLYLIDNISAGIKNINE